LLLRLHRASPSGLFVAAIMVIVLSPSDNAGVYANEKGDVLAEEGTRVPAPLWVRVTLVALPPKLLPVTVTGVIPQVLPVRLLRVTVGPFIHPHETLNGTPDFSHPEEFFAVI
jgi:hypothetical protein